MHNFRQNADDRCDRTIYEKHTLERMKEDLIVVPRNAGIRSSFFSLLPCLNRKTCYNIYCDSLEYAYIIMLVKID